MKIKLDERHTLISDQYCCWIEQARHSDKKGTDYQVRVSGYCGTINQALESYIDRKLLGSDAESAEELLREIRLLKEVLKKISDNINAKILEALA